MDDVIRAFFEGVGGPHPSTPRTISGTLRFDVHDGQHREHWRVTFDKGSVMAAESDAPADCVVRIDRATLADIIEGRVNAMAALLRGALELEGRTLLLAVFRSLFGAPAISPKETERSRQGRRRP